MKKPCIRVGFSTAIRHTPEDETSGCTTASFLLLCDKKKKSGRSNSWRESVFWAHIPGYIQSIIEEKSRQQEPEGTSHIHSQEHSEHEFLHFLLFLDSPGPKPREWHHPQWVDLPSHLSERNRQSPTDLPVDQSNLDCSSQGLPFRVILDSVDLTTKLNMNMKRSKKRHMGKFRRRRGGKKWCNYNLKK